MTLHRLEPSQYAIVRPLFKELEFCLEIRSIIAGNTPAWVFVDHPIQPTTALLWDQQGGLILAGDTQQGLEISKIIIDQILPDARPRYIPEMELLYSPPHWQSVISNLLSDFNPVEIQRYAYRYEGPLIDWRSQIPAEYEVRRIDDGLLESSLDHLGDVRGWIDSFWPSPAHFLHTGFGYCALTGDTIAAWCLTVFVAGNARELGLATVPEFRNKGLATLVGAACVEHTLADNAIPEWHCNADNPASSRIAEKIGFQKEREYTAIRFSTNPE